MSEPARARRGALLLFSASLLWGIAFLPQRFSVEHLDPLSAIAVRFSLAALLGVLVARRSLRSPGVPWPSPLLLGGVMYVAFLLQTAALTMTPVSRVSLVTGLYAVFTPLLAPLFGAPRPLALHWCGAVVALVGLAFLVGLAGAAAVPFNVGDVYTLGHALLSSVHILLVSRLARHAKPWALNALQLVTMAAVAVPVALVLRGVPDPALVFSTKAGLSFLYLAVFASVLAFGAQIYGQRYASPSAASVIILLEAPIGTMAAMWLLGERMTWMQGAGGVVLLAGVGLSLYGEVVAQRRSEQAVR